MRKALDGWFALAGNHEQRACAGKHFQDFSCWQEFAGVQEGF
jgi:hypothetical protein